MSLYHRTDHWIDDFQMKLSTPVAMKIAEFCRNPEPHPETKRLAPPPLMGVHEFVKISPEKLVGENRLYVILGPFGVAHDERFTYWQGIKVFVGAVTVAAVLCRLNPKGNGGFYNVKLWDIYSQGYIYHGDPAQERQIHPNGVIKIVNDHMAAQYHVGSVEQDEYAAQNEEITKSDKQIVYGDVEAARRESFEREAERMFRRTK
jgi:hypothetical protein